MQSSILVQGFITGISLIMPIGAQNAFLLERGVLRNHAWLAAGICFLGDVSLIVLGVGGIGALLQQSQILLDMLTGGGALFLAWYGGSSLIKCRQLWQAHRNENAARQNRLNSQQVILSTLAVTFLNPHVYLDTVVIQGSVSGQFARWQQSQFVTGSLLASAVWFFGLAWTAKTCAHPLEQPKTQAILQLCIGLLMWWLSSHLGWQLWQRC